MPDQETSNDSGGKDFIYEVFLNLRRVAKKRNGSVPNLGRGAALGGSRPVMDVSPVEGIVVPGVDTTPPERRLWPTVGRPTGLDGRALPRTDTVQGLGDLVRKQIHHQRWTPDLAYGWVKGHWGEIAGERIGSHSEVERIDNGELVIVCNTMAQATELKYMQRAILEEVSKHVGPATISSVRVTSREKTTDVRRRSQRGRRGSR